MQVVETLNEGLAREFTVSLAANEIEEKVLARLEEVASTATLPGFRPGKVPVKVLRKRFGPAVMGEVLEQAVNDSSQQALMERGLTPAAQPEIEVISFEEGKDLEYKIAIEVLPEIEPMDFSKLKLEKMTLTPDEKAVDEALERMASMHKSTAPLKRKRKSKSGDVVVIDFLGKVDGEAFAGGAAENYELELGSNSFIPGFEDQLVGTNAGDEVNVNVQFPADYGAEQLAGKDAVFECKVHEIKEAVPAEINDELATKMGLTDLAALKERIVDEQRREFDEVAGMQLKRKILDLLADEHAFEIPPKMAEREFDAIWQQFQEDKKQNDASVDEGDEAVSEEDKPEEEQKAEFKDIADRRVKLGLLLSEVGRRNAIEVSPDDVNRAMMREAQKYPGQEQQVLEYFRSNEAVQAQLKAPIYEDKIVDYIIELADVAEKPSTFEELMKSIEAEQASDEAEETPKKKAAKKPAAKKKAAADGEEAPKKAAPKKKPAAKKAPAKTEADDAE